MDPKELVARMQRQAGYQKFRDGSQVVSLKTGTRYTLEHVQPTASGVPMATVRRTDRKVKGKAARRAEKKARRAARGLL